ncbi:Protein DETOXIFICATION [Rhynchospora pubera]|uniref:Protein DETOXIFICATION n=1 Tax=Rhynchospora pubera TaxID=906938 RepID=A0AAV8F6F6_9POAL|nr:Protein DETOXIFICATION [Rhynchospora pubera]
MWMPVIGQFAYVLCGGCPLTWKGFTWSAFTDLWLVVKLSLSSGAMICLELWYSSILVLLTGYMANAEVALDALSICLNIAFWGCMISLGFLAAAGDAVADAVIDMTPLLAITILLNSMQQVLSGAAVGAGWQTLVAYVNVACYYLVGVPLGVILGYVIGYEVKVK